MIDDDFLIESLISVMVMTTAMRIKRHKLKSEHPFIFNAPKQKLQLFSKLSIILMK